MTDPLSPLEAAEREPARRTAMPRWHAPMLATLSHADIDDDGWCFERKLDGERVIARIRPGGEVQLYSRNHRRLDASYPDIEAALARQAPRGCLLDGEVVAFDARHRSDFQRLQPRMQAADREEARRSGVRVYYYLFDCLYACGHDLTGCTLRSRKKLLRTLIDWRAPLRWTPHRIQDGPGYHRQACDRGWEGLIAKRADSAYVAGRSREWRKWKCRHQQEFVIGGHTEPHGEREGLGALLLGVYQEDELVYAGKVGTGFDAAMLATLKDRLSPLARETSPFQRGDPPREGVRFVSPRLVCEVAFTEWTRDGRLRHPSFQGLRRDKAPRDVHRED
ncbi:non-homologous end-joining DNA ligase [Halomonas beimenensis]|uniref:DNA ligase (ATP) n=1 Tax=Halomonas beimenensis TaxID=475662 RepID=A0A291P369_9GAMM|nr:non-homologous end-joining DNA ligase [Halomonas beimenensis]ATJ81334.1 ATP-dependent DNA ligase clustered with Ku protein, LigD [Halomonas beimenensis]